MRESSNSTGKKTQDKIEQGQGRHDGEFIQYRSANWNTEDQFCYSLYPSKKNGSWSFASQERNPTTVFWENYSEKVKGNTEQHQSHVAQQVYNIRIKKYA